MRQLMLLILLMTGIAGCFGQDDLHSGCADVTADRIELDGTRQVMSKTKDFNIGEHTYSFYIKAYATTWDTTYYLGISSYYYIPENAEILLKTKDGETMHFFADYVHVGKVNIPGRSVITGNQNSYTATNLPAKEVDYYSSTYKLSKDNIRAILNNKVKKIRISNGRDFFDREFGGNMLGRWLKNCYWAVDCNLKTAKNEKPKSIYDKF